MLPRLALVAAVAAASLAVSGPAAAAPQSVATSFVRSFLTGGDELCRTASPRMAASIARAADAATCAATATKLRAAADRGAESAAEERLRRVRSIAKDLQAAAIAELDFKDVWFGPGYKLDRLAQDLRRSAEDYVLRVGTGPAAARRTPVNVVVLDRRRTTPRRLVLYTETPAGRILELVSPTAGKPRVAPSSTRGVRQPVTLPPSTSVALRPSGPDGGLTLVSALPVGQTQPTEFLVDVVDGRVDSLEFGVAALPLAASASGGGDVRDVAGTLAAAYTSGSREKSCALFDQRFRTVLSYRLLGCPPWEKQPSTVRGDSVTQLANGHALVTLDVGAAPDRISVRHLMRPTSGSHAVVGLFFSFEELLAQLLRPI